MKISNLKLIIKEIVSVVMQEMNKEWAIEGDDVFFNDIELSNGQVIGAEVKLNGNWQGNQYAIDDWHIIRAWFSGNETPIQLTDDIKNVINNYVGSRIQNIESSISQDPPDHSDDKYDRWKDA